MSENYKYNLRYYACNESRARGIESKCRAAAVRADAIEADVWAEIEELFSDLDRLWSQLKAAQQEELHEQDPKREELEAIEANIKHTDQEAAELVRTLAILTKSDPEGVVAKKMQAQVDQTNELYRAQIRRRDEMIAEFGERHLTDEAIVEIMQYARDVREGVRDADFAAKRRMLESLRVEVEVKNGHYKIKCVLAETEGTVRKIPRVDSRAVVTDLRWCNDRNDTVR